MHSLCLELRDLEYEENLFMKYQNYLQLNKDNPESPIDLNKIMKTMGNMIEIFSLNNAMNHEYWKYLHISLELILNKANKNLPTTKNSIYLISGALFMITKIWLRCPSILKANGELLNFFWYFLGQKSFDENDKVAILEIYHEFLCDLKKKFSSNNEEDELNLGGFIDTMKTDINSHLGILFSTNVALRRI